MSLPLQTQPLVKMDYAGGVRRSLGKPPQSLRLPPLSFVVVSLTIFDHHPCRLVGLESKNGVNKISGMDFGELGEYDYESTHASLGGLESAV